VVHEINIISHQKIYNQLHKNELRGTFFINTLPSMS